MRRKQWLDSFVEHVREEEVTITDNNLRRNHDFNPCREGERLSFAIMQAIYEMGIDFDASFDLSGFDVVIKSYLCILQQFGSLLRRLLPYIMVFSPKKEACRVLHSRF